MVPLDTDTPADTDLAAPVETDTPLDTDAVPMETDTPLDTGVSMDTDMVGAADTDATDAARTCTCHGVVSTSCTRTGQVCYFYPPPDPNNPYAPPVPLPDDCMCD